MEEKTRQQNKKKSRKQKNDQLGEDLLGNWAKFQQNGLKIGGKKLWNSAEIDNKKVLDILNFCIYIVICTIVTVGMRAESDFYYTS